MEYVQMTLNDWLEMKEKIRRELQSVKHSFVRIGYALRQIEDGKLYEQDGYKSIAEFARAEYGLEPSTTSRFISINREYSIDGYSERLRPEYEQMGRSQLEEMLKLPAADRAMIGAETPREDIRELKRFNAAGPETGIADDVKGVVEKFFHDNPDALNDLFTALEEGDVDAAHISEIINPSGSRAYKKGLYFLMMYENRVSVKRFGQDPQDMGWKEFADITNDIFGEAAGGGNTWKNYFGGDEDEKEQCGSVQPETEETVQADVSENSERRADEEETAEKQGEADVEDIERETEQKIPTHESQDEDAGVIVETLPTKVKLDQENNLESVRKAGIAPAQLSQETTENRDDLEAKNIADKASIETPEEPGGAAGSKEKEVVILNDEKQALISAYDAIGDIAGRYSWDLRENMIGSCLYDIAQSIRIVMDHEGTVLTNVFSDKGEE